jgi:hypothetical protein
MVPSSLNVKTLYKQFGEHVTDILAKSQADIKQDDVSPYVKHFDEFDDDKATKSVNKDVDGGGLENRI